MPQRAYFVFLLGIFSLIHNETFFSGQAHLKPRSETLVNGHDISIWQCFVEVNYRESETHYELGAPCQK